MPYALCIENLPAHGGTAGVDRLLKPFGPVRCTAMLTDPDVLRQHPGIALLELSTARQARAAMAALDGRSYRGGTLRVRPAVAADFTRANWICRWDQPVRESPGRRGRLSPGHPP